MSLPRQHSVQTNCDSKASLEELFGVLNQPANDGSRPSTWSDRKLPPSFYKEPDSRHGTRSPCGAAVGHQSPKRLATGLQVVHGRSVSSPANLPHSLSAAVIKTTPQHSRQNSFDGFLDGRTASPADAACSPQPANWQDRETKFARHSTDGALPTDFTAATVQLQQAAMKQTAMVSGVRSNTNVAVHQLASAEFSPSPDSLPLPPGWERGTTPDGEVYYIDHNTRSTSWTHPALVTAQNQQTTVQQATHRQFSGSVQPGVQHAQHKTIDGTHGRRLSTEQIIQQQLMQIQQDKLRIQRETELVQQRERQLSELMRRSAVISSPTLGNATLIDQSGAVGPGGAGLGAIMLSQQSAMARSPAIGIGSQHPGGGGTSGPDGFPVLCGGGVPSVHSVHARQSSGDSGLGGMGATYSLSRVDDYLCNVDERMDIHEGLPLGLGGGNTFGNQFNGIELGLADPTIDGEQLVSTLNDLTGDLGSVGDMDIQNTDSLLTWL